MTKDEFESIAKVHEAWFKILAALRDDADRRVNEAVAIINRQTTPEDKIKVSLDIIKRIHERSKQP